MSFIAFSSNRIVIFTNQVILIVIYLKKLPIIATVPKKLNEKQKRLLIKYFLI
jgi:hypothetical protein